MQTQNKPRWILRNPPSEYSYWQIKFGEFPLSFEFNISFSELLGCWLLTNNSLDWRTARVLEVNCETWDKKSDQVQNAIEAAETLLFETFSDAQDLFQQLPF